MTRLPGSGLGDASGAPQFLNPPSHEEAAFVVLPVPLEATVSYAGGTRLGPSAILEASAQVEYYDREFDCEPVVEYGIVTVPEMILSEQLPLAIDQIAGRVEELARTGKTLCVLGGEHSLTLGVGRGLYAALGQPFTVVQLDAHCDLRDRYDDTPYSHACVARRLLEHDYVEQVLQLGIRALCPEEVGFIRAHPDRVRVWYAENVHAGSWQQEFVERVRGRDVLLTLDVDGLDPSVVSSTGTPEPDGLSWREGLEIIRLVAEHARVIGFDCVELAPVEGRHASDYAVAKLVYKTMNYIWKQGGQA